MKRLGGRIALCALLLTVALVGSSLAASDTQTAALAVKRFVARNRATCHGKLNLFVPETGINTAAGFFGVVSCNGAALHG